MNVFCGGEQKEDVHPDALSAVCALLGRRYPVAFDAAVQRKLTHLKAQRTTADSKSATPAADGASAHDTLSALLNEALAGTRHQLMSQSGTTLHSSFQVSLHPLSLIACLCSLTDLSVVWCVACP